MHFIAAEMGINLELIESLAVLRIGSIFQSCKVATTAVSIGFNGSQFVL